MPPETEDTYQKMLTEVLQKQMLVLGPTIALAKARNVKGLIVTDEGEVTGVAGEHAEVVQKLLDQFRDLSDSLVIATMQPLLDYQKEHIQPYQKPPLPEQKTTESAPAPEEQLKL